MGEIPVRMSGGSVALVDLHDMDRRPRTLAVANARNISHGVWPPLTAITKRPRAATANLASSAMIAAALWATESTVSRTSMLMARVADDGGVFAR